MEAGPESIFRRNTDKEYFYDLKKLESCKVCLMKNIGIIILILVVFYFFFKNRAK